MDKLKIAYGDIGYKDARHAVFRSATVIAKASIPVLIITNRYDDEVPFEENRAVFAQDLGDVAHVIIKEGQRRRHIIRMVCPKILKSFANG